MAKFRFVRLQSVIFTPDFALANNLALINWFSNATQNIFDGEVISFPIPQEAPPEIPRIILQSRDKKWNLNISLLRTDLSFLSTHSNPSNITLEEFTEASKQLFSSYKNEHNILIQRLAIITERTLIDLDGSPAQYLTENFCKEQFIQGPDHPKGEGAFFNSKSFELHNLKKYLWESFHVNSWVRLKATSLIGQEEHPVLFIHNDINTQPEKITPEGYSSENIKTFFTKVPSEIDNILQLYFG